MASEIPGFTRVAPVAADTIERYRGRLPDAVLELWQSHGYGHGVDGFIKVVDPDLYREQLGTALPSERLIPVLATGMADLLVWDEADQKNRILRYRYGRFNAFMSDWKYVIADLADREALAEDWMWGPYPEAVARLGAPAYEQCFTYVPLLALGGPESADHLEKGDLTTHLELITQLAGPIPYY